VAKPALDLSQLTRDERLELLEELWDSLSRESDRYHSPKNKRRSWTDALTDSTAKVPLVFPLKRCAPVSATARREGPRLRLQRGGR
jgi:hypothetical protein